MKKLKACIIKGNPDRMVGKEELAKNYYNEISTFLVSKNFDVIMSESEPKTCPPVRDIAVWVAHSRGVGRIICLPKGKEKYFAKLGSLDGAINPDDEVFQKRVSKQYRDSIADMPMSEQPPKDHFIFSDTHKQEVMRVIDNYLVDKVSNEDQPPSLNW